MNQSATGTRADHPKPTCIVDCKDILGEGAFWEERDQSLIWVDIYGMRVHQWWSGSRQHRSWDMPERIGFVIPRRRGGYIAGLKTGLAWLDLPSGTLTAIGSPEPRLPGNRFNDGKCDARGRLWAGTMDDSMVNASGSLYRYESSLAHAVADDGYVVTNGPTFSPDERTLYHTASITRTIFAFDVSPESGALTRKRVFHQFTEEYGYPDGMATDTGGGVWVAMSGSSRLLRLSPAGMIDRDIPMPVTRPTSCVFGGPEYRTLYVTSATVMLAAEILAKEPLAGGLFSIDVGAQGFPGNRFAG